MVYFIKAGASGDIKIGWAKHPEKRLKELQTGSAPTLYLLGCVEGGQAVERAWHIVLNDYRVRGEWFKAEPVTRVLETLFDCVLPRSELALQYPGAVDACEVCDHSIEYPTRVVEEGSGHLTFLYRCHKCRNSWTCNYALSRAASKGLVAA